MNELLEGQGAARRTDPATSHDAASKAKVGLLHVVIINVLAKGEHTVSEIALETGLPRDSLSPRMKKLVALELVEDTGRTRKPLVGNEPIPGLRSQIVWKLTAKGMSYVEQRRT